MGVTLSGALAGSPRDDTIRELTRTTATLYPKRALGAHIQDSFDRAGNVGDAQIVNRLGSGPFDCIRLANLSVSS